MRYFASGDSSAWQERTTIYISRIKSKTQCEGIAIAIEITGFQLIRNCVFWYIRFLVNWNHVILIIISISSHCVLDLIVRILTHRYNNQQIASVARMGRAKLQMLGFERGGSASSEFMFKGEGVSFFLSFSYPLIVECSSLFHPLQSYIYYLRSFFLPLRSLSSFGHDFIK